MKRMTWQELKEAYEIRIANLVPKVQGEATRGMKALEEYLQKKFPEVIQNPFLMAGDRGHSMGIAVLGSGYRSTHAWLALRRLKKMLITIPAPDKLHENITANDSGFAH